MGDNGQPSIEFLEVIKRAFSYLFTAYGFSSELCTDDRAGEYRLVVLKSSQCKIRFEMWQEVPEISFGSLDAPARQPNPGKGARPIWFDVNQILGFLRSVQAKLQRDSPQQKIGGSWPDTLGWYSERLLPYIETVTEVFSSAAPRDWWRAYDEYHQGRLRKIRASSS